MAKSDAGNKNCGTRGCNRALAKVYRWQQALNPDEVRPVHGLTMRSEEAF